MQQWPQTPNKQSITPLLRRALAAHQSGRLDEAEPLYRAILTAQANHFDALHLIGVVQYQQGRPAEALHNIGASLRLRPDNAAVLNNLGLVHAMLRRPAEALTCYDRALALTPDYAEAFDNRGNALRDLERFEEALASHDSAVALNPDYAAAFNNRSGVLIALRRFAKALADCDRALALNPGLAEAHINRGAALAAFGRPSEALASYDSAIALNRRLAEAHHGRGLVLLELGHLREANDAIEQAIRLAPRNPRYYYSLGQSRRYSSGEPHIAAMEALASETSSLSGSEQIDLNFALGGALGDIGFYERSFRLLLDGNASRRKQLAYDEPGALEMLERTRSAFTAARMRASAGHGDPSAVPVFVVGMPRSGTTLIEQILASHAGVFGAGEIDEFNNAIAALGDGGARGLHSPDAAAVLSSEQLRRLGAGYVARLQATAPWATRIVNKMPKNFRHLGLIHLALPNARVIHARRDPVDTCLSCFSRQFPDNLPYTYDLAELGRYYRAYEAVMAHWRGVLPQDVMLEVRYEDVVADLEGMARRIVAHCGLDWDPHCLAFHQTERAVRTASAAEVRRPVYTNSVGRWRPYRPFLAPLYAALELADSPAPGEGQAGAARGPH